MEPYDYGSIIYILPNEDTERPSLDFFAKNVGIVPLNFLGSGRFQSKYVISNKHIIFNQNIPCITSLNYATHDIKKIYTNFILIMPNDKNSHSTSFA